MSWGWSERVGRVSLGAQREDVISSWGIRVAEKKVQRG